MRKYLIIYTTLIYTIALDMNNIFTWLESFYYIISDLKVEKGSLPPLLNEYFDVDNRDLRWHLTPWFTADYITMPVTIFCSLFIRKFRDRSPHLLCSSTTPPHSFIWHSFVNICHPLYKFYLITSLTEWYQQKQGVFY